MNNIPNSPRGGVYLGDFYVYGFFCASYSWATPKMRDLEVVRTLMPTKRRTNCDSFDRFGCYCSNIFDFPPLSRQTSHSCDVDLTAWLLSVDSADTTHQRQSRTAKLRIWTLRIWCVFRPRTRLKLVAPYLRTRSTTTRDRRLQSRGAVSTGFFFRIFSSGFFPFSPGFLCTVEFKNDYV